MTFKIGDEVIYLGGNKELDKVLKKGEVYFVKEYHEYDGYGSFAIDFSIGDKFFVVMEEFDFFKLV